MADAEASYGVADAGIFHFNENLISSNLIQHDGLEFEVLTGLVDDKCFGLDVGERHDESQE